MFRTSLLVSINKNELVVKSHILYITNEFFLILIAKTNIKVPTSRLVNTPVIDGRRLYFLWDTETEITLRAILVIWYFNGIGSGLQREQERIDHVLHCSNVCINFFITNTKI